MRLICSAGAIKVGVVAPGASADIIGISDHSKLRALFTKAGITHERQI
jgi:hypothetical protein